MKRVLVVDDTKNIRVLLSKCLQMEGYDVTAAVDGPEAREILLRESFDLAFIDIKLPYLSGTEVIKQIRERGINTPVIVITAYATVKNAVECTQMGAVAYLQKPFTADKVKSVLNEIFTINGNNENDTVADTLKKINELIELKSYSPALGLLKETLPNHLENPEIYLLLSKVYEGLGKMDYSNNFLKTYEMFAHSNDDKSK